MHCVDAEEIEGTIVIAMDTPNNGNLFKIAPWLNYHAVLRTLKAKKKLLQKTRRKRNLF